MAVASVRYNGTIHEDGLLDAPVAVSSTEAALRQASAELAVSPGPSTERAEQMTVMWPDRLDSATAFLLGPVPPHARVHRGLHIDR